MTRAKFDIEKFHGTSNFRLWRIKMRALLIQHGCEAALEIILPILIDTRRSVEERAGGHWSMAVLNLRNGTIDVYDSLHGTYDELTRRALESFL
ncbi:retrovirus-related pol polyprotein from transposon TNT 1-94 [Tanacetum coccineum]